MEHYYVNEQAQFNGDHEVHKETCSYLPVPVNRKYLGYFSTCREAVEKAKLYYTRVNGCYYCCKECHTG